MISKSLKQALDSASRTFFIDLNNFLRDSSDTEPTLADFFQRQSCILSNSFKKDRFVSQLCVKRHFFNSEFHLNFYEIEQLDDSEILGFNFLPDGSMEFWKIKFSEIELDEVDEAPIYERTIGDILSEYGIL